MSVSSSCMSDSLQPHGLSLPGLSAHGISRQEYWSKLPFSSPGDLLDSGIEPGSPALQADSLLSEPPGKPLRRGILAFPAVWEEGEADITVKT